jgi:threonine dehydratase
LLEQAMGPPLCLAEMPRARILRLPVDDTPHITLAHVQRAEERIMRHLRYTPLMTAWLSGDDGTRFKVHLKLENLQITEGFAVRGMLNAALELSARQLAHGLVGYGLMHGPAAAYVAHVLQVPATVFLYPSSATPDLVRSLEYWGARTRVVGKSLADTERAARVHAEQHGLTYIHSSANPGFIAGCATIALEMLEFAPALDVLVAAVGFGPLIAGIAAAAKQIKPSIRVVGVDRDEPRNGYPFADDVPHTWRRLQLGSILDRAAQPSLDLVNRFADDIALVSQAEILDVAHRLWTELEIRTGSFGSSAVAALLLGRVRAEADESIGAVISTAGGDGLF